MKKAMILGVLALATGGAAVAQPAQRMTLEECLLQTYQANYGLQSATLRTEQARNNVTIAPFSPGVSATARQNQSAVGEEVTNTAGASVNLSWRIFDGLGMFATHGLQKERLNVSELQLHQDVLTLTSEVMGQYYLLVSLRTRVDAARELMELSHERNKITLLKYDQRSASGLEVALSKTDLNADSSNLVKQQEALRVAYVTMNQLMNRPLEQIDYVRDSIWMGPTLELPWLETQARQKNPSILLAEAGVRISELELKQARAGRYPTLDFGAGYAYNLTDAPNRTGTFSNSDGPNWGFTLGVPIFNGLETNRRVRNAKLEQVIGQTSRSEAELTVLSQLEKLYVNYRNNLQLIGFETENANAARWNLELAMERYRLGELSGIDFRTIQLQYLSAMDRKISVIYQAKLSEVALLALAGELLEDSL